MTPRDFAQHLRTACQGPFRKEQYNLLRNNCRNFCEYLIFNILRPTEQENGKWFNTWFNTKKQDFLAREYLQTLVDKQACFSKIVDAIPFLKSSADLCRFVNQTL